MAHFILFSGHMIDKQGRSPARFPPKKEVAAAKAIYDVLKKIKASGDAVNFCGLAAAACGGDILFHEACQALHIPSEIYLGIPVNAFLQTSVAFAGKQWVERYRALVRTLPVHILFPEADATVSDSIWEKANQWMLGLSLANGGQHMTLVALWNGKAGDSQGGTGHMIRVAKARAAAVDIINIDRL